MSSRFYADTTQGNAMAGFLEEISVRISTPQHVGPILKWIHSEMSDEFTAHMATLAPAHRAAFHHVYEWGQIGKPEGQLWQDVLRGNGNVRVASFIWKASTKTVPVRADFQAVGVQQVHVFTWKAPVMEYDTNITISPQNGKGLAYFSGPTNPEDKWPMRFTKNPITVMYPGGEATKGAFTNEYVAWWSGAGASGLFQRKLRRILEHDLASMPLGTAMGPFRAGTRSRSKTIGLAVQAEAIEATNSGREAARAYLAARDRRYIDGARARSAIIGGEFEE